jgi:hypothetical protein
MWGKEKLGPILRKLTMSEGAVSGESVGKTTCGGRRHAREQSLLAS